MLGKKYLLTKCHKTFKFLSYLCPEEAEIPLLDKNNLSGWFSMLHNTCKKTFCALPFLRTRFISAAEGTISSKRRILKKKHVKFAVRYIWLFQKRNKTNKQTNLSLWLYLQQVHLKHRKKIRSSLTQVLFFSVICDGQSSCDNFNSFAGWFYLELVTPQTILKYIFKARLIWTSKFIWQTILF